MGLFTNNTTTCDDKKNVYIAVNRVVMGVIFIFSVINIFTAVLGHGMFFFTTAKIPFMVAWLPWTFLEDPVTTDFIPYMIGAFALCLPYILATIFSKKHLCWIIIGFVYYLIDSVAAIYLYLEGYHTDADLLFVVFRAILFVSLIYGFISTIIIKAKDEEYLYVD